VTGSTLAPPPTTPVPEQPRVLFVGAFPPRDRKVFGGMVTACRTLLRSSFSRRLDLDLLDSTQLDHPPPRFPVRAVMAVRRLAIYVHRLVFRPPSAVLLFAATGMSLLEKGVMARLARLRGVPAFLFPRAGAVMEESRRSPLARRWTRWSFDGASGIFCQGQRWRRYFGDLLDASPAETPIVPNWTATPELLEIGRERVFRRNGPVRLLFVGWLEREKGVEELLDACAELEGRHAFTLELVGAGRLLPPSPVEREPEGSAARIRFRGWLEGEELRNAYRDADVFVLPSWAEGMPNALIEAMAAGLPVVTTPVGAIRDFVVAEEHALLVPPRDGVRLAAALARLIEDGALRRRLGRAAHGLAASCFCVERAADIMVREFEAVHERRLAGAL
jgi:glycosyltransferase involved in cell wall biosynthesis